jgi:hypothetical protein
VSSVAICTPTAGTVKASYCLSVVGLIAYYLANPVKGHEKEERFVMYDLMIGSMISTSREFMVESVLEGDSATHVLFLDDDMGFSHDCLNIALSRDKDIVLANYRRKSPPWTFTARKWDGNGGDTECLTANDSEGLEEVLFGGFGFCLITVDALRKLSPPRFEQKWIADRGQYTTEDAPFMEKMKAAGVSCYVDHDISKKVYHVGDFVYRHSDQIAAHTDHKTNRFAL